MKKLILSLSALMFGQSGGAANELVEFSTSMDFEEFQVVLRHLAAVDSTLAEELTAIIERFQASSSSGDVKEYELDEGPGHVVLEREDPHAVGVATFTAAEAQAKIEAAYLRATEELGI